MRAGDRIAALKVKARQQQLVILVWGPGDPGSGGSDLLRKYWQKRNQIRDNIASLYPNAEVMFSEDPALREHTKGLGSTLDQELLDAQIADCILVLDVSRGAHVEVDRFTSSPEIAAKMTILIPDAYIGGTGLVSQVHRHANVLGFSDEELDRCEVATVKSVSAVDTAAINRLLSQPRYSV